MMKFDARKDKIINYIKAYGRITSNDVQSLVGVHRNTALKDLKRLQQENIIRSFGQGKGTYYQLADQIIFEPQIIQKLFNKNQKTIMERYFRQPNRKSVFFDKVQSKALAENFAPPDQFNQKADELKTLLVNVKKELSLHEQKRKKQRLVVDLSWASSHIEGNTYSILETEALIEHQETAHGKKYIEAKMILNHKEAIEHIRQYKDYRILSKTKIFELHQILVDGLSVQTGLRKHLVRISNSVYVPCDNEFQITQTLDDIIQTINATPSILQKAIMANLLVAFLQPFSDGNKRTARMLGNALLVSHGLLPISFSHTPKDEYMKSVLYFYEKQDPAYFISLFFQELNTSFLEYIE